MATVGILGRLLPRIASDEPGLELVGGVRRGRVLPLAGLPGVGRRWPELGLELSGAFPYLRLTSVYGAAVPVPMDFASLPGVRDSEFADLRLTSVARSAQNSNPIAPPVTNCGSCTDCSSCASCTSCCSCASCSSCSSCSSCDCGSCGCGSCGS
jgi:hypothetical protein